MKMKRRECKCTDWKENIHKVNAANMLLHARNPSTYKGYEGVSFKYCPWCSSILMDHTMTHENTVTHKMRSSDSSQYDEVCTQCGATDAADDVTLYDECPGEQASGN